MFVLLFIYSFLNLLQKDWTEIYQDITFDILVVGLMSGFFTPLISTPLFFQNLVYVPASLRYNPHIIKCTFEVYNSMVWGIFT